ncbi:SDR family NAD(P)-dependent oxidoreductase [Maritimibacter fusiformis]|uniref:SDR family oxidoreductase n=1 Tax=Maritimibacter fusiformis TaxID=2603819 RepID=A0A5D0RP42_9RHOB|nr:SDR family NAD(P)-dependent oxidoreductase [Maritimibacter fusiformis]TYB83322.1 SDR family oxidoreductase [Maritimibacter fusiformis]
MKPLDGKRALVTGARHGIGAEIARVMATQGAHVAVCGRNAGDCDEVVAEIVNAGGQAFDHGLDVSDLGAIAGRIDAAADVLGGLDIVVNNAAVIEPMARIAALDPVEFDRAARVNLSGPAAVIAAGWQHLRGGGRILNLLSGAAVAPLEGWAAYCASKAGLLMLTRCADLEGAPEGIRAFGLSPGVVDTEMQVAIRAAKINRVSDIPRENLSPVTQPARMAAWLVGGDADDLAGSMADIRDPDIRSRMGWAD